MAADRQRTLRELEVGRTLVKDGSRWVIKHTSADYKTGDLQLLLCADSRKKGVCFGKVCL